MENLTDVAVTILAYKRPDKTKTVIQSLANFSGQRIYFFVDGPRANRDEVAVNAVRQLQGLMAGFAVESRFSKSNKGLKQSVLSALDEVFTRETISIVLEDDCLPNASFFRFIEKTKDMLRLNSKIALISGNTFVWEPERENAYFSNQAHIWGWMTTSSTWREFRASELGSCSGRLSLRTILKLLTVPEPVYFKARNLHLALNVHRLDSWAIYFSCWVQLNKKLVLHPPRNFVTNIGFDLDATHTGRGAPDLQLESHEMHSFLLPTKVKLDSATMNRHARERALRLFTYFLAEGKAVLKTQPLLRHIRRGGSRES